MTTTVTIDAHCDPKTTKVRVVIGDSNSADEEKFFMEDGESASHPIYDGREIHVKEVPK